MRKVILIVLASVYLVHGQLAATWRYVPVGDMVDGDRTFRLPVGNWTMTLLADDTYIWNRLGNAGAGSWASSSCGIRFQTSDSTLEQWEYELVGDTLTLIDWDRYNQAELFVFARQGTVTKRVAEPLGAPAPRGEPALYELDGQVVPRDSRSAPPGAYISSQGEQRSVVTVPGRKSD